MPIDPYQVRSNAQAFLDALTGMSAKQKEQPPTVQYGEQFNQLLLLAIEVVPGVDGRLWPKSLGVKQPVGMGPITDARYVEIETYTRQILNLLPKES